MMGFSSWVGVCGRGVSTYFESLRRGRQKRLRRQQQCRWESRLVETLGDRSLLTLVNFPTVIADVTVTSGDGDVITAFLRGDAQIDVSDTPTELADGRDTVQTEIVSMNLQGFDSYNGPVVVRVSDMIPSIGGTAERREVVDGVIDTSFNVDSFFDVFIEVDAIVEDPMNPSQVIQATLYGNAEVVTGGAGSRGVPVAGGDSMSLVAPFELFLDPGHMFSSGFLVEELDLTFEADFTSISGQKWHDLDGDGVKEPGEPGLDDWIIVALDLSTNLPVEAAITRSVDLDMSGTIDPDTESGLFEFTTLPPGRYFITEMQQTGWAQTYPEAVPTGELPQFGPGDDWLPFVREGSDFLTVGMLITFDWDNDGAGDEVVFVEGDAGVLVGNYDSMSDSVPIEVGAFELYGISTRGPVHLVTGDSDTNLMNDGPLHLGGTFTQDPMDAGLADSFFDIFVELDVGNTLGSGMPDPATVWANSTAIRVESSVDRLPPMGLPYRMTNASPVPFFDQGMMQQAQIVDLRFTNFRPELFNETVGYFYTITQGQEISNVLFGNQDVATGPFGIDYGDANDFFYPTLAAQNGASHQIDGKHFLGQRVDAEDDGQPNWNATGDDLNNPQFSIRSDDEDGVAFLTPLVSGQMADILVQGSRVATGQMLLSAWIDWNANGDWSDMGDQVFTDVAINPGSNQLSISVPAGLDPNVVTARFRVSTESGLSFTGMASNGEVEDYTAYLWPSDPPATDWGDAPDPLDATPGSYPTLAAHNGAYHLIDGITLIGNFIDGENDGQPNIEAKGDLLYGVYDDEDGIVVREPLAVGRGGDIDVSTLIGGFLNAWIDFNADGDWDDPGEQIYSDFPVGPGRNTLFVNVPGIDQGVEFGETFARFRLSPNPGEVTGPTGPAVNMSNPGGIGFGEVEDVALTIYHGELIAETLHWEVAALPQDVPPAIGEEDSGDPVGIVALETQTSADSSIELLNQEWYWFAIDGGAPQRLDTLTLIDASAQFENPLTLTYGDVVDGDPIQVTVTVTLNETSVLTASYSTSVAITNLTGSPIDVDFWSYTDLDLNGELGRLDRATVASTSQINVTGVTGSAVAHQITGTPPDHYQVGTVGSSGTAFAFQTGTNTDLNDTPSVGMTTAAGNVAHAFQWSRTISAAATLTLDATAGGTAVPVNLPGQRPGGSVSIGFDTGGSNAGGGFGGIGGSASFGGSSAPTTGTPQSFDPAIAIGYDFDATVNRFATVELPTGIGDDQYSLSYLDDLSALRTVSLAGGVEFDFNSDPNVANGVSSFRVLGIEASTMIDVEDPLGFATMLSFVDAGPFSHTQTGIPEFIYVAGAPGQLREDTDISGTLGVLEAGDEGTWLPGTASEETGLTFGYTLFDSLTDAQSFVAASGYTGLTEIVTSPAAQVTSVSPQAASHTATAATNISATFDQAISGSTVTDQTFVVQALQTGRLLTADGNMLSVSGGTITLDPAMDFKPGELVHVTATAGIEGPGEIGVEPYVWQFTIEATAGSGVLADSGQLLGGSSDTFGLALGDLDGDGDLDAFVANDTGQANRVLINQGGAQGGTIGVFVDSGQALGGSNSLDVALGDVDGDGDLDAVVANSAYQSNRLWLNQGGTQGGTPGVFADSGQSLTGGQTRGVALGDLDADGDLDIFFVNYLSSERTVILLNDGSGVFATNGQVLTGHASRDVAIGDLDGDGDLDAYVAGGGADRVWLNQGGMQAGTPGTFSDSGQTLGSDESQGVALGDVDGDGDLDAFVTNASGSNRLWINQGGAQSGTAGEFSDSGQTLGSGSNWMVALGDLDADGDLDALVTRRAGGDNQVWLNQGGLQGGTTGVFSDSGQSLGTYDTRNVVLADVNGDGSLDAFLGVFRAANRVLINVGSDFGDAPSPYLTTLAEDGPRHLLATAGLHLGASVDAEADGVHSTGSIADDVADALPDDEDGVLSSLDLQGTEGAAPTITLLVTNTSGTTATLAGWIDYNGDGVFDNSTERATTTIATGMTDARVTLTFPAIPDGSAVATYARFRLSTDAAFVAAPASTGVADDGEVEDYAFRISVSGDGTVDNSVRIASSTNGGPTLDDGDKFARSVAALGDLDGDGVPDLVAGASEDDTGGTNRGAVYIHFMNADGTVKSSTKIASDSGGGPSLADSDYFGTSVASLGDLDGDGIVDLAVGAGFDDTGAANAGAVYILFLDTDGAAKSTVKIASGLNGGPGLSLNDGFGGSVAGTGDIDGDGVPDLAVGALFDDTGAAFSDRGAVYVLFMNPDGTARSTVKIASSTNGGPSLSTYDNFGTSVAGIGDLDGDGVVDLAVGAHRDDTGGTNRGAVHILFLNENGTVKSRNLIGSDTAGGPTLTDGDQFGISLASPGDLDGDGVQDLVAGALTDATGGTNRGAVYVLHMNSDGSVADSVKIAHETNGGPTLADGDLFGISVTAIGDVNADGIVDLAVGASDDDTGGSNRGAVHVLFLAPVSVAGPAEVTLPAGNNYEVLIDGSDTVVRVSGGSELFRNQTALVTSLTINGSAGDDTLTVDFSNGSPIPGGGLSFDGAGQSSGDSLVLTGGTVATATYQFASASDGQIDLDGQSITFTGLEPISDNLSVTDRVFTYSTADDDIRLDDDGVAGNNVSRITATGTAESVDFSSPSGSLTINAGAGQDSLSIVSTDSMFAAAITANGDDGADQFNVAPLASATIALDGGTPTSVAGPLDHLTFDLQGVGTPQLTVQPGEGGVLASTTHGSVTESNMRAVSASNGQYELIVDLPTLGTEDGVSDEITIKRINYDLVPVALGNTSSPDPFLQFFDAPAINNNGQVAFLALRSGMPENLQGVFVADVNGFATAGLEGQTFADGTFTSSFSEVSLADSGVAAYRATIELSGMSGTFGGGVFGGDGSSITTFGSVAADPFAGPNYFAGYLSEDGTAVLSAGVSFGADLHVNTGAGPFLLYDSSTLGSDIGAFFGPDINNSGVISAVAGASPGVFRFVVTGSGGGLTTVADASDMAFGLRGNSIATNTSINEAGTVAFVARADTADGEYGVYTGNGGPLTLVADTTGNINLFSSYGPSINDSGTVAFTAILNDSSRGIYTGPATSGYKIVAVGDLLAGGTIQYVESGRFALNDNSEVAFYASLGGGREVIAIAEPITPHLQVAVNGLPVFTGEFSGIGTITVNGSADDDNLMVDSENGNPIPSGGLNFNGGGQTGTGDALQLEGSATTVTHTFTSSSSGSASVDGQVINYTGLEPIVDMTDAANRVFTFGDGDDVVELSDGQFANDGLLRLTSVASSELLDFSLPTTSLTINLGGGADSLLISVDDLDGFAGAVTFNGDAGADSVDALLFTLPVSINGGDDDDTLSGGSADDALDGGDGSDLIVQTGDTDFTLTSTQLVSTLTGTDSLTSIDRAQLTGGASDNVLDVSAFGGPTTLIGGDGNDTLTGSPFADNLTGNGGDDLIVGGDGNDTLNGGTGKDELIGGDGNDLIQGQGSTGDTLDGGDGDDTLDGGSGNDLIRESFAGDATLTNSTMTGRGNDVVISSERAELTGGGAAQTIDVSAFFTAGLTSVTLDGGGGNDTLLGSDGSDVLVGSGGSDRIEGNAGHDRIIGGSGADTLIGGDGNDFIKGLGGSGDRLSGGAGDDTLNGGRGVDRLFEIGDVDFTLTTTTLTGLGNDRVQAIEIAELNGGPSDNVIDVSAFVGFKGFTQLRGNGGNDLLIGSPMGDVLNGDAGNDTLLGKAGNDTLNGGDGNDGLSGFTGNDVLDGGRGYDRLFGGEGNDSLTGGNALDTLIGGDGDDTLAGNDGTDTLVGGTGNNDPSMGDTFNDATAVIDEAFMLDPLPDWVDQV